MVKRKYADYLVGSDRRMPSGGDPDEAVGSAGPARAWLQRAAVDDDAANGRAQLVEVDDDWTMTLERQGRATNHAGAFDDLVALAVSAGTDEFHVWSSAGGEFVLFTAQSVRRLD